MYTINMVTVNEFNEDYANLDGICINETTLHTIWREVTNRHRRTISDFFPSFGKYMLSIPMMHINDIKQDELHVIDNVTNIIVEETEPSDYNLSLKDYELIKDFMYKILAYRFSNVFSYDFSNLIIDKGHNMWNCQLKYRDTDYNKTAFIEYVDCFVKDSTDEAIYHNECMCEKIDHTMKHRISKYIQTFDKFSEMIEYSIFNAIRYVDNNYIQFITTSHVNGELLSVKRGRLIPYTFIACLYKMLDDMGNKYEETLALQVSLVYYNKIKKENN